MNIQFRQAEHSDALFIARGFHMAMLMEDVPDSQIQLFARQICSRDDVLYSAPNTTIAIVEDEPMGMVTAYDGRFYHAWRQQTMQLVKQHLGIEFPGMEDEALPGEYYIDSLAVLPPHRGRGIGRALLQKAISDGLSLNLQPTLAVDPVNTRAQALYRSLGFRYHSDLFIFGHTYHKYILAE